jgi:hypothetical protein
MPEFMGSRLVNLTILSKKNLSHLKFPEAKSQRREKKYLRGALDSAQFFIA